ncbi:unnamed protein product [Moneuplotes crassus]|uniref:Uncharacterized protein n=1 Tax=Euplotes crassus TaxID=5936 RepID=A0AAD2D4J9_EUPCR|nr:unnamed protein product [Moneuplotes crassus]
MNKSKEGKRKNSKIRCKKMSKLKPTTLDSKKDFISFNRSQIGKKSIRQSNIRHKNEQNPFGCKIPLGLDASKSMASRAMSAHGTGRASMRTVSSQKSDFTKFQQPELGSDNTKVPTFQQENTLHASRKKTQTSKIGSSKQNTQGKQNNNLRRDKDTIHFLEQPNSKPVDSIMKENKVHFSYKLRQRLLKQFAELDIDREISSFRNQKAQQRNTHPVKQQYQEHINSITSISNTYISTITQKYNTKSFLSECQNKYRKFYNPSKVLASSKFQRRRVPLSRLKFKKDPSVSSSRNRYSRMDREYLAAYAKKSFKPPICSSDTARSPLSDQDFNLIFDDSHFHSIEPQIKLHSRLTTHSNKTKNLAEGSKDRHLTNPNLTSTNHIRSPTVLFHQRLVDLIIPIQKPSKRLRDSRLFSEVLENCKILSGCPKINMKTN